MKEQIVHSFDLWGPIVDSVALGQQKIALYREIAPRRRLSPEQIEETAANYQRLCRGDPWATGERKRGIITALEGILTPDDLCGIDYKKTFQPDALYALPNILDANQGVIVFTSAPAPWLKRNLPEEIRERMGKVYVGRKTEPSEFNRVIAEEAAGQRVVVSHTADELPELRAALQSKLMLDGTLVYIARNNVSSEETIRREGIDLFATSLRDVDYIGIGKRYFSRRERL